MTGLAGEGARTNFKRAGGDDVVGWQLAGACRADVKDDNQIIPTTKFLVDTNNIRMLSESGMHACKFHEVPTAAILKSLTSTLYGRKTHSILTASVVVARP